jgi:low temperature requirement protein LtrA
VPEPELLEAADEHRATPLELFFDLVFVFAFIQVTTSLVEDPTWPGVVRGMLVLAALWWAWAVYAWLTSAADLDEGWVRLTTLAAMGAMLFVALAVPQALGEQAVLFGCAYLLVRVLHVVLSAIVARDDADRRSALVRFVPTSVLGPLLILAAGFVDDDVRLWVWLVALAIDYLGPVVFGMGRGWHVAPGHFAERYELIILIALGESIIAIGFGAGDDLAAGVLIAAALAVALVSALWWLYFDVAVIFSRARLAQTDGINRARLARDSVQLLASADGGRHRQLRVRDRNDSARRAPTAGWGRGSGAVRWHGAVSAGSRRVPGPRDPPCLSAADHRCDGAARPDSGCRDDPRTGDVGLGHRRLLVSRGIGGHRAP